MKRVWFVAVLAAPAACGDKAAEVPASSVGGTLVGSARGDAAGSGSSVVDLSERRREDLSKLPNRLAATIAIPVDAKLESTSEPQRGADGLLVKAPAVFVNGIGPALKLTTGAELGWVPTTAADDLAENARRERPFAVAAQQESPGGEWAIAYRWDAQMCHVRGWSPRAKVFCSVDTKVQCAQAATLLAMCISLEPSGPPVVLAPDPAATFSTVTDPRAVEAAAAVARAVARNDREALVKLVDARGLVLKGKRVTRDGLRKLLADDTVQKLFEIDCTPPQGSREVSCTWNSEGTGADGTLAILARSGYGVIPQLTFTRGADGAWQLTKVEMADLGGP